MQRVCLAQDHTPIFSSGNGPGIKKLALPTDDQVGIPALPLISPVSSDLKFLCHFKWEQ